ncbi:unnamed protein product [Miscanthus lutarioriparius]|uniref:Uncharacterized protein n=1 Tax=Miscanthus lutarioriparius TaxID=422564 RepID=A0A811QUR5_9POAL|nr:unnamed protein product [Miscanthus lutarioriparius]
MAEVESFSCVRGGSEFGNVIDLLGGANRGILKNRRGKREGENGTRIHFASLWCFGTAQQQPGGSSAAAAQQEGGGSAGSPYFLDEEALFETPQYLRNMAAGMMMSPPRFGHNSSDDSPDHPSSSDAGDSLWSYRDP